MLEWRFARIKNDIGLKVQHALKFFERHIHECPDPAGEALQKPDVCHGAGKVNMAHSFTTDFRLNDLDPALLADNASMTHPFVFATITLIVFGRSKYFCAKKPVTLRLKRAIIDGFRFLDLAMGPRANHLFGRQRDLDRIKTERILGFFKKTQKIFHFVLTSPY